MKSQRVFQTLKKENYRSQDYKTVILQPIPTSKNQFRNYDLDFKNKAPRYITGYTGKNIIFLNQIYSINNRFHTNTQLPLRQIVLPGRRRQRIRIPNQQTPKNPNGRKRNQRNVQSEKCAQNNFN